MGRKKGRMPVEIAAPTPEQNREGAFIIDDVMDRRAGGVSIRIGKAYRRQPMIDILRTAGILDAEDHRALRHYRHHADLADRSPIRDSLCLQRGGNGAGPTVSTLNAARVRDDCERAAGTLADILRAVVVYDKSLSQWAIEQHGGVEECYKRKGGNIYQIKPRSGMLKRARMDIKMAAVRVRAELDA